MGNNGDGIKTGLAQRLSKFDRTILVELELHASESSRHRQDTLARQLGGVGDCGLDRLAIQSGIASEKFFDIDVGSEVVEDYRDRNSGVTKQALPWHTLGSTEMCLRQSMRLSVVSDSIGPRSEVA